ncbi:hypothetical protein GE061_017968 [Apolygus lucorum]|uniref:sphingomyelin phosphodiesterase n=1 Tax=Apolygus lucorum TaxID=248454 RepID=A0A6A4ITZ8_APOLU|nr:hypothetical protein GE061_017968 [Apolygus lucorum]
MTELKVFTMNVWGIPYVSKDKSSRMEAIAEALKSKDYDIICLQEIWDTNDYELIHSKIKTRMPYKYYYYSGFLGSGLCTFSKWPIVETFYYKFPLNGYVHKIHHGDWFAGKGVALAKLKVNDKIINVFNTHLHAQYCQENDEYLSHRLSQSYEAGQLVSLGSEGAALTLFLGDFNSKPSDICTQVLRTIPGLQDAFLHNDKECDYGTNETTRNSYTPPEVLKKNPHGGRLDYILFKSNNQHEAKSLKYDFAFPDRIPNCSMSYSDHEAIEATIVVKDKETTNLLDRPDDDIKEIVHRT